MINSSRWREKFIKNFFLSWILIKRIFFAEDEKARIDGARKYDLNVGENSIDIVIVSESGAENRINIKVTRKDGYYLEDLDSLLKNDKTKDIDITINSDTKLTSSDVEKIKKSKKKVKLNYYNDDKSLLYSLIISGKKIKAVSAFETEVKFDSENRENILKLSNYADGLYFSKKQGNKIPKGTLIKLFVGNKYTNKEIVNIYSFDSALEKLVTIKTNLKVKDGYVEFEFPENKDFFVTMSMLGATKETTFLQKVLNNAFVALLLLVVLTLGVVLKVILKKKRDNKLNVFDK